MHRGPQFAIQVPHDLVQRPIGPAVNRPENVVVTTVVAQPDSFWVVPTCFRDRIYAKIMTELGSFIIVEGWERTHLSAPCLTGRSESPLACPSACCGTRAGGSLSAVLDAV